MRRAFLRTLARPLRAERPAGPPPITMTSKCGRGVMATALARDKSPKRLAKNIIGIQSVGIEKQSFSVGMIPRYRFARCRGSKFISSQPQVSTENGTSIQKRKRKACQ